MTIPTTSPAPAPQPARGDAGPTCATCPYWLHGYRGQHPDFAWITERVTKFIGGREERTPIYFGDCRRHAARPAAMEDGDSFGRTHRDDWCGDHPAFPAFLTRQEPSHAL